MTTETATTTWTLKGTGYEFCNCDFGCGCNFGGFPNSKDGSCQALIGFDISEGTSGGVDLSGVKCAAVVAWPKAIHEGNGKCVFVVDPSTTEEQVGQLAQIFTGQLGGMPWELLGTTFEVVGLEKAKITIEGNGPASTFTVDGIAEGRGAAFKNPVTGEDHFANIDLPNGFIWTKGECGQGTHHAKAGEVSVGAENSNWILYGFDWPNA